MVDDSKVNHNDVKALASLKATDTVIKHLLCNRQGQRPRASSQKVPLGVLDIVRAIAHAKIIHKSLMQAIHLIKMTNRRDKTIGLSLKTKSQNKGMAFLKLTILLRLPAMAAAILDKSDDRGDLRQGSCDRMTKEQVNP